MSNLQGSSGDADIDNRPVDKSRGTGGWGEAEMNEESSGQHGSIYTMCVLNHCSHVWFFVTLQTVGLQAPLSVGFSRQEYWSELPCPPPEDLPYPGIEPMSLRSPVLPGRFFTTSATWEAQAYTPPYVKQAPMEICSMTQGAHIGAP